MSPELQSLMEAADDFLAAVRRVAAADAVRMLSIEQAAERLGVDETTVRRLVRSGDLVPTRITPSTKTDGRPARRGRVLFHPDDVNECIERMRARSRMRPMAVSDTRRRSTA